MARKKRIVTVTGATGFVGRYLIDGLLQEKDYAVRCQVRRDHFDEINERGASNVYAACLSAGVKKVVQVSTPLAYGVPDDIPFDENAAAGPHANAASISTVV